MVIRVDFVFSPGSIRHDEVRRRIMALNALEFEAQRLNAPRKQCWNIAKLLNHQVKKDITYVFPAECCFAALAVDVSDCMQAS